jgi:hypothetical protein
MRLIVLTLMGLMAGLGLAAAIVSVPVMAEKGPLRDTLVADLGGAQEELPGGGDPDGRGRAVVKVFEEQLCGRVKTSAIESSSSKATINLGMSGENGPTVANLQEERAATPTTGTTTGTTAGTTGTTTGTTGGTTGTTTGTTGTTTGTTGTTTPLPDTTTATAGTTGAQTGTTTITTTGDTTLAQATTTEQSTTLAQSSPSQFTASPTASASASASAASASAAPILEHTGGCVEVPRALSLELLEHPRRYYVNVSNGQYPEGAIKGQLHRSADHRSGEHRSGDGDDD